MVGWMAGRIYLICCGVGGGCSKPAKSTHNNFSHAPIAGNGRRQLATDLHTRKAHLSKLQMDGTLGGGVGVGIGIGIGIGVGMVMNEILTTTEVAVPALKTK